MLRRECHSGSQLGNTLQAILASGQLVSDDLINQVVASRLRQRDCEAGFILDGYPRTVAQARFLDRLLAALHMPKPVVFQFDISPDEVVSRITRRLQCTTCGRILSIDPSSRSQSMVCDADGTLLVQRADDNETAVRERLRVYESNASQLIRHYQKRQLSSD